jgi:SAM-dependent methyltransferase
MGLYGFVTEQLPSAPARVLEVGCGRGDLARAIAESGYEVVAIDPDAPAGDLFQAVTLDQFADPSRSTPSSPAWRCTTSRTFRARSTRSCPSWGRPGRLIVNEHAVDRLDEPTARWYLEKRAVIRPAAPRSLEQCLHDWEEHHAGLHGYAAMRKELDLRFTERFFAWMPYLYGELTGAVTDLEERALIDAGAIQATGFRYVGERHLNQTA